MIDKNLIKAEIDHVQDEYLEILYKIIKALEQPSETSDEKLNWHLFIEQTYGCLANDPIERGYQGKYEIREKIE